MKVYTMPERSLWSELCRRPAADMSDIRADVESILLSVREGGDSAVRDYTRRFDGIVVDNPVVPSEILSSAVDSLDRSVLRALETASETIHRFHAAQVRPPVVVQTSRGVECRLETRPLSSVGIYVPGGTAPLVSTVLMLAIPARLAGVQRVILTTPPRLNGLPDPTVLAASRLCNVDIVYTAGGAQAVAAMAYGTESLPAVRLIAGPGNPWVTIAKQMVQADGIGIDVPAGPSEVLVLADATAPPEYVAADLLAQAEHGIDSQVLFVTTAPDLVPRVQEALEQQLRSLPRAAIARRALTSSSIIVFGTMSDAVAFTEAYAPEHLIVMTQNDEEISAQITTAGSVFLGIHTPESLGDYASGTNHTLPTGGWAAVAGGVTLDTFRRTVTVQRATPEGLSSLADTVVTLARAEGLEGHARSILIRGPGPIQNLPTPILLHANEHPDGVLGEAACRYPDPKQNDLRAAVASYAGVSVENIAVGNGSDELLDLVVRTTCSPGHSSVVIPEPTFVMYGHAARLHHTTIISVASEAPQWWNVDRVITAVKPDTALVMLCSPNNPVGYRIPPADVLRIVDETSATVLLDEAYIDFSEGPTMIQDAINRDRLIVMRTFSKAWGLASVRVGWLCAAPSIVATIQSAQSPFSVGNWASQTVQWALRSQRKTMMNSVARTVTRRQQLAESLSMLSVVEHVEPSEANFLLVRFHVFDRVKAALENANIVVRDRSSEPGCERCLRISIGTQREIDQLLNVLGGLS